MKLENIPNILTVLRFALVIPLTIGLAHHRYQVAFGVFVAAGITDLFDGLLARRYGWVSRFGSISDPIADKLLLAVCFIMTAYVEVIPIWVAALVVFRDVWIVAGAACYHFFIGRYRFKPSLLSKWNTVFQLTFIATILFDLAFDYIPTMFIKAQEVIVVFTTVATLVDYTLVWGGRAFKAVRTKHDATD